MSSEQTIVMIAGPGRNGSTMLSRLLDGSEGLWIYPIDYDFYRAHRFLALKVARQMLMGLHLDAVSAYFGCFLSYARSQWQNLHESYIDLLEEPLSTPSAEEMLHVVKTHLVGDLDSDAIMLLEVVQSMTDHRPRAKLRNLVIKSTEIEYLARYQRTFPQMRFVHLVRDPVSNYESLKRTVLMHKQKPFWFHDGDLLYSHVERRWLHHVHFAIEGLARDPSKHLILRYEDIIADPKYWVGQVCSWLEVAEPVEPEKLTVLGGLHMKKLPDNASQPGVETPRAVDSALKKKHEYSNVLTKREKRWIAFRLSKYARLLGYPSEKLPSLNFATRLAFIKEWLPTDEWEQMNTKGKLTALFFRIRKRLYVGYHAFFTKPPSPPPVAITVGKISRGKSPHEALQLQQK